MYCETEPHVRNRTWCLTQRNITTQPPTKLYRRLCRVWDEIQHFSQSRARDHPSVPEAAACQQVNTVGCCVLICYATISDKHNSDMVNMLWNTHISWFWRVDVLVQLQHQSSWTGTRVDCKALGDPFWGWRLPNLLLFASGFMGDIPWSTPLGWSRLAFLPAGPAQQCGPKMQPYN
jgi:hypothetical protein